MGLCLSMCEVGVRAGGVCDCCDGCIVRECGRKSRGMSQSGLHQGVSDAKKKKIKRGASTWNVLMMLTPATPGNALWVWREWSDTG